MKSIEHNFLVCLSALRAFAVFFVFNSTVFAQTTYFVNNVTGADTSAGTSLSSPKRSIQSAITAAASGDTISVAATGQLYTEMVVVSGKTVVFASTDSIPRLAGLTINQPSLDYTLQLAGSFAVDSLVLVNGLIVTGSNILTLKQGTKFSDQGYDRRGVVGSNISHVVGNVRKQVQATRNEFPVGTMSRFRPATITFAENPNSQITVAYVDSTPKGIVGMPIQHGISYCVPISRYAPFYWQITSEYVLDSVEYDLELMALGYTDYADILNVRIIRRYGTGADSQNTWMLQGRPPDGCFLCDIPVAISLDGSGGLRPEGAIFTYGMRGNLVGPPGLTIPTLTDEKPTFRRSLRNPPVFNCSLGELSYSATIDDSTIASIELTAAPTETLIVTRKRTGTTVLRITAIDAANGERQTYSTGLAVVTSVETIAGVFPQDYYLSQNYPNPFNPSTTIEFGLPMEGYTELKIYNFLGQEIETLVNERMNAGSYRVNWNAASYAAGVYFYRLKAGQFVETRKLILLK